MGPGIAFFIVSPRLVRQKVFGCLAWNTGTKRRYPAHIKEDGAALVVGSVTVMVNSVVIGHVRAGVMSTMIGMNGITKEHIIMIFL
jgi:hypothetical protein